MRPVTVPDADFAAANPVLLAMLGLQRLGERVRDALPAEPADLSLPRTTTGPVATPTHPLDLGLLGLIALAERLGAIASGPAAPLPEAPRLGDLLR